MVIQEYMVYLSNGEKVTISDPMTRRVPVRCLLVTRNPLLRSTQETAF